MTEWSFNRMPNELTIEDYTAAVTNLAKNKSELIFKNIDPEQAAIVMATIIDNSDFEVRIYENCLKGDVADKHNSFGKSLKRFLQAGKNIKMALRENLECDSKIFNQVCEFSSDYPNHLDIRLANEEFRTNIKDVMTKDVYFIVGDNQAYRMETIEEITLERKAICSFNGPEIALRLKGAFDKNFLRCEPIHFPVTA